MKAQQRMNDAERAIVPIIWQKYPITVSEMIDELQKVGCT